MGELINRVIVFLKDGDFFDYVYTLFKEKPELLIVVVAVVYIMVLSLWTMLERLRKRGVTALVPIYRFAVLFSSVGLNSWLSILLLIPGVNLVMRIVFYVHVARKFHRSYFLVPFLTILPIVFLPVVAFGDGKCYHARLNKIKDTKKKVIAGSDVNKENDDGIKSETQQTSAPVRKDTPVSPFKTPTVIPPKIPLGTVAKTRQEVAPAFLPKAEEKKTGFSITIDGSDEAEEIHVLTMSELKQERAQIKEAQKGHEIIINDYSISEPEQTSRPKLEPIKQARKEKSEEYQRLLRQQQRSKHTNRRTMDIMAKKKAPATLKKQSGKIEIKIS